VFSTACRQAPEPLDPREPLRSRARTDAVSDLARTKRLRSKSRVVDLAPADRIGTSLRPDRRVARGAIGRSRLDHDWPCATWRYLDLTMIGILAITYCYLNYGDFNR